MGRPRKSSVALTVELSQQDYQQLAISAHAAGKVTDEYFESLVRSWIGAARPLPLLDKVLAAPAAAPPPPPPGPPPEAPVLARAVRGK